MTTLEQRLAFVEGRVREQSQMFTGIRDAVKDLERRMERRFEAVDGRFAQIDGRFAQVDVRLTELDRTFDRRFQDADEKSARQFMWLVGMHVTTILALVAAILAR